MFCCRSRVVLLVGLFLIAGTASAHDLYIVAEPFRTAQGRSITIGFHSGDAFPQSGEVPKRLREASLHSAEGVVALGEPGPDVKRSIASATLPKSGHYIATIIAAANTISMEPGEFLDYLKEEGLTHVIDARTKSGDDKKAARERYTKYAKSILLAGAPNDIYKKVVGLPIEIVPEKDPYALKPGESLPVRVLIRGKPAAGLEIRTASDGKIASTGKTSADGRLSIPLKAPGPYRLHALHMERVNDGSADWESLWATLTFEVR
jgi:hypothetical protein